MQAEMFKLFGERSDRGNAEHLRGSVHISIFIELLLLDGVAGSIFVY